MEENSPPDAVLMGGPIGILYLHTGRQGVSLWGRLSKEEILSRIQGYKVSHIVVYPEKDYGKDTGQAFTAKNLSELVNSDQGELAPLYQTGEVLIYLVKGEKTRIKSVDLD
jgi:hypothetical protein